MGLVQVPEAGWVVLMVAVLALPVLAPAVMTGIGSRRRGAGWTVTALSAAAFPVTWVVWYLLDPPRARERRG